MYHYHASVVTFYGYKLLFCFFFLQNGMTALIAASANGHTETVKCLIDGNAKIDLQGGASLLQSIL